MTVCFLILPISPQHRLLGRKYRQIKVKKIASKLFLKIPVNYYFTFSPIESVFKENIVIVSKIDAESSA